MSRHWNNVCDILEHKYFKLDLELGDLQLNVLIFKYFALKADQEPTMTIMTPMPEMMRGSRSLSGKYGSLMPVIGFFSIAGAIAAYSGRGRSYNK